MVPLMDLDLEQQWGLCWDQERDQGLVTGWDLELEMHWGQGLAGQWGQGRNLELVLEWGLLMVQG